MRHYLLLLCLVLSSAYGEDFRYHNLEQLIRDHRVTTVDELLPLLPESYRRSYIFVYASRSQQKENTFPDHPRTILTGRDGQFIMAFTKSPSEPPKVNTGDVIETIEFDEQAAKFMFRRLTFQPGTNPIDPPPETNPATCLACHGTDPRPNWDAYNVWPGVYGSVSRLGCDSANAKSPEAAFYKHFMSTERDRGRYAFLPVGHRDETCPDKEDITIAGGLDSDTNARFTENVFDMNNLRLKRLVRESGNFETFKYLWAGAANGCLQSGSEDFFPPSYAKERGLPSFKETLDKVVAIAKLDYKRRLARFSQTNAGSPTDSSRQPINFLDPDDALGGSYSHRSEIQVLKFAADRAGIDMVKDRWATGFTDGSLDYATPHSSPEEITRKIGNELLPNMTCKQLEEKSREAIAARAGR